MVSTDGLAERLAHLEPPFGITEFASRVNLSQSMISKIARKQQRRTHRTNAEQIHQMLDELGIPPAPTAPNPKSAENSPDGSVLEGIRSRDLNSSAQRKALDSLRHLTVGRKGVRISREELAAALILVHNEGLDVELGGVTGWLLNTERSE